MQETKNLLWRPEKYSPKQLEEEASKYFDHCENTMVTNNYGKEIAKPKTISWLCVWLKVDKDYIADKMIHENFSRIVKNIRMEIENDIEEWAMTGKYNPTVSTLNLSSNFNWKAKSEVDSNTKLSWSFSLLSLSQASAEVPKINPFVQE